MSLAIIRELSNRYGADPSCVLAGGGNTSYKDEKYLYVKPSGVALADITESDFVKMEREVIRRVFSLPEYADAAEREAMVTKLMAFAVAGSGARRPSVEAPLHELMPFTYIVHLHPVDRETVYVHGNDRHTRFRAFGPEGDLVYHHFPDMADEEAVTRQVAQTVGWG